MSTKIFLSSFVLLLISFCAEAQIRDQASVWYQGMSSDSGESSIGEAWLSERWFMDEDGTKLLQAGLQTRRTEVNIPDVQNDLWMIVPQVNYLHSINDRYSLITNLRLGLFSDMGIITSQDVRAEGAVVLDVFENESFTWGAGIGRVSNFGRVIYVPLFHIVWSISPKWMMDAMLPGRLDLLYLPSSKLETGLSFNILGSRYNIESKERRVDSIGVAQMNLGPMMRYQISPSLYLAVESGLAFARRVSLMDQNTEVREFNPNNEIFLRSGLQYRF